MLRSPIRWLGGKFCIRKEIVRLMPPHECYVEVFSGAGWVLFGKPPELSKAEVLNDLDGELVNFWRVIKHRPAEFTEAMEWGIASEELFHEWKPLPGVGGEVGRAVRFYVVCRLAFGARMNKPSFGYKFNKRPELFWADVKEEAKAVVQRLRQVWIRRLPWEDCIRLYNRPTTFFYLDPPYHCAGAKGYRHWFTDEDHARLADVLRGVKAKWLLSYNDDPFIRRLYRWRGLQMRELSWTYSAAKGKRPLGKELLIANYPLAAEVRV